MTSSAPAKAELGQRVLLGISFKVIGVTIFLIMGALIKTANDIPTGQTVFFRSLFAIIPIAILLAMRGELLQGFKTHQPVKHLLRAIIGVGAMSCMFLALRHLSLADATAIQYATPIIIVVLSALIFKEQVRLFRSIAVLVGVVGVSIIIWPNLSFFDNNMDAGDTRSFGVIVALCGAGLAAGAQLTVRGLVRTESSATIVLYFSLAASAITLLSLPFGWILPSPGQFALLITIGFLGGIGQIFATESYRHADMSIVAPFEYSSLILSILIGYFFFAEVPTSNMIIGGLIVIAAGIAIILRERRLGLERAAARKASTPQG
jgi:drug/metabolite transporter (DMT)-like permease